MIKQILAGLFTTAMIFGISVTNAQSRSNDNVADQLNAKVLNDLRAAPATATPGAASPALLNGVYIGANAGGNFQNSSDYQVGAVVGYQLHPNFAAEVAYDFNRQGNGNDGQAVMGNLIAGYRLGQSAFTPYVLAGAGIGWNAFGEKNTGNNTGLYNVGGGLRVNLVQNVDLDLRYRYVGPFESGETSNQHVATGGLAIRF